MTDKIIVLTTCASSEQATEIALHLLESHLAACVNILPGVRSVYRWQGKVEEEHEHLLIIKTRRDLFDRLTTAVQVIHKYDVPEVLALPVVAGSERYLEWLDREVVAHQP